jgi:hypothetical protein
LKKIENKINTKGRMATRISAGIIGSIVDALNEFRNEVATALNEVALIIDYWVS